MDIELLKEAIENEDNFSIIQTNIQTIKSTINDVLQNIGLNKTDLKAYNRSLKNYRYIDNPNNLTCGNVIRYIKLNDKNKSLRLNCSVIICDVQFLKKGIALSVRTFNNRFFTLYYEENLIFQKITAEEDVILKAIKYLSKTD